MVDCGVILSDQFFVKIFPQDKEIYHYIYMYMPLYSDPHREKRLDPDHAYFLIGYLITLLYAFHFLYRKDKTDVGDWSDRKSKDRESFDSREILEVYGKYR